jgi:ATP-dependent RNA helicase HelY
MATTPALPSLDVTFEPDPFQRSACTALDEGASVLVAAPTGSGKTYIAEHAIRSALASGRRAFYTAPIKALSNQKFRDFQGLFGESRVGLLTGDTSINPDAPILVMTTEVLRNMIYARSDALEDLAFVVLDEVHFLQDEYRGPVWEEVIIHLPLEVSLVCLSATVSNADEVASWLTTVRGDTRAIVESRRPVPLEHHHAFHDRATGMTRILPTLEGTRANDKLKRVVTSQGSSSHRDRRQRDRDSRVGPPSRTEVIEELQQLDMLPAIFFIFSRNQCDEAAKACRRNALSFVSASESKRIREIADRYGSRLSLDERRALDFDGFVELMASGVAPHHAGLVPAFKEMVEEAFTAGLVKVVFATETLAVGINMPARSVVIDKLTRYTGERHIPLKPSDFTQLTGRAGRRGIDKVGHAITLWSPFVSLDEVVRYATNRTFTLTSAFRPTYNMTVNLVRTHAEREVRHLLNLSLAQYQSNANVVAIQARLERRREALALAAARAESSYGDIWAYRRARGLGVDAPARSANDKTLWETIRPGDVLSGLCDGQEEKLLVVATAARKRGLKITVVDHRQRVRGMLLDDFDATPRVVGRLPLDDDFSVWDSADVKVVAKRLSTFRHRASAQDSLRTDNESVTSDPQLREKMRHADNADRIRRDIERIETQLVGEAGTVAAIFDRVLGLLRSRGFIDGWSLTPSGTILSGIFHECDILVAEAIERGFFDGLGVADLAGAVASLVYERRSADDVDHPHPSDRVKAVIERLEDLSIEIRDAEESAGLPVHRFPDNGFSRAASVWATGGSLTKILDVVPDMGAGDFVRTVRQLVDLLRQIERTAADPEVSKTAAKAAEAMFRGLVVGSEAPAGSTPGSVS